MLLVGLRMFDPHTVLRQKPTNFHPLSFRKRTYRENHFDKA